MPALRVPRHVLDALVGHAREAAPEEACGALAGRRAGADVVVVRAERVANASAEPRRAYVLEPTGLFAFVREAEADGLDVVGFYHSHPEGPAHLSARDAAEASWPVAYVLVSLAPTTVVRAWSWDEAEGAFAPLTVAVE